MAIHAVAAIIEKPKPCAHNPRRLYAWYASDDTPCVCCCDCGAVLTGGAK